MLRQHSPGIRHARPSGHTPSATHTPPAQLPAQRDRSEALVLPVLSGSAESRAQHREWHAYFEAVYGHPVDTTVDLNQFEWFYSSAPLHLHSVLPREAWPNEQSPDGLVFYNRQWSAGDLALAGHFVWRGNATWDRLVRQFPARGRVEVVRAACSSEHGSVWFYPLRGSGVSLDLDAAEQLPGVSAAVGLNGFWSTTRLSDVNATRAILSRHPFPELVLRGKDLYGKHGCPSSPRVNLRSVLRSGFGGRSSCMCNSRSLVINCGRPGLPAPSLRYEGVLGLKGQKEMC